MSLGTRLFPAAKEQPKGVLPIFSRSMNGDVCLFETEDE